MTDFLFVYGTLVREAGHEIHEHLARDAEYLGEAYFRGRLYNVAHYPGAVASTAPADKVFGELYRLNKPDELLLHLDAYEGCGPNDPQPTLYVRQVGTVQVESAEPVEAWIYLYNGPVTGLRRIPSGRFMVS
jgi:gamma-glutamylcyclotransferase (GGCT)/AIG2-like uncharacterized protein YtfP